MNKVIDTLVTRRNTWRDVIVFASAAEAKAAGYHLLYEDDLIQGSIYGKMLELYSWDAAVVFWEK